MFPVCDGFQESEADLALAGPGSSNPAGYCKYLASTWQVPGKHLASTWPVPGKSLASAWERNVSARVAACGNVIESPPAED